MDLENVSLLNLLFGDEDKEKLEDNVNFNEYMWKLGTLTSEELTKEPNKLKDEKLSIQEQTQELAVSNYKTFIQTAECSRSLFQNFNHIEAKLFNLLENIPEFEQKCHTFVSRTSGINMQRRLNSLTLTRTAQLLEILELPQLMDSFIKDELYEDALELAMYVRQLYNKHPDIPIFKNITEDINKAWLIMLHRLLAQLRGDLLLSQCLQIVNYLRRMEVFTEVELRIKFLQARQVWLRKSLVITEDNANHRLNKIIEVTRVNLFSIITQYKAIFNDDEHNLAKNQNQNLIFCSWIGNMISEFLTTLENELTTNEVTSIESILGQCMYFGLSFSRVGCDFRAAMVPIFNNAISGNFEAAVLRATRTFEKNMERFTLINKNHPNVPWKNKNNDPIQPPESLLEFYPLAEYLNQILIAFNELRLCPPIAIILSIINYLNESLMFISKAIFVLYGQEQQAFTSNSKDAFIRFCLCFVDDLVPYIQKCINIIYPPNCVAAHVSCTVQNLQKDKIIVLDKVAIIAPLKHLLPIKIEPVININTDLSMIDVNKSDSTEEKNIVHDSNQEETTENT